MHDDADYLSNDFVQQNSLYPNADRSEGTAARWKRMTTLVDQQLVTTWARFMFRSIYCSGQLRINELVDNLWLLMVKESRSSTG
jgi:hypothetical protein